jgi:hypothetical protein
MGDRGLKLGSEELKKGDMHEAVKNRHLTQLGLESLLDRVRGVKSV